MCDAGTEELSSTEPSDTTVGKLPLSISKILLKECLSLFAAKYCANIELSRAEWLRRIKRNSTVRSQHRVRASPRAATLELDILSDPTSLRVLA